MHDGLRQVERYIQERYALQGFWQAKVKSSYTILPNYSHCVDVYVAVEENVQLRIKNITLDHSLSCLEALPTGLFESIGQPLSSIILAHQRQLLINFLHKHGYIYTHVHYELLPNSAEPCSITICWHIQGFLKKIRFGKLIIQGSSRFAFNNIYREVLFSSGEVYNQQKLTNSLDKLVNLSIFESVHLAAHLPDQAQETKDVIATLLYDDPFEVRLRLGFQQVSKTFLAFAQGTTYKVGGSFLYKNPTQSADILSLQGDATRFYRNIVGSYERPWLFSQYPLRTIIKCYTNHYIQPLFIGSDKSLYETIQQGIVAALRRRWSKLDIGLSTGNEWIKTNHVSQELAKAINFAPALVDQKVPYVFLESDIALNYLDNQLNPQQGSLSVGSLKLMIPWRALKAQQGFLKFLFDQSVFIPLSSSSVLGSRIRFGHIINKDFNHLMPPERFYLGGQNSIRSYQPDFGPPLGLCVAADGAEQRVPQGARSMITFNLELRQNIWKGLGIVLFQDMGALFNSMSLQNIHDNLIAATGFGLRYLTPVGPIRFDLGFKWKRYYPHESLYAWFLTLGHAF